MSRTLVLRFALPALLTLLAPLPAPAETPPTQVDIDKALAGAKKYTAPGEHHKLLERFLGTWDSEARFAMSPAGAKPDKGTMTYSWLMEGRWIKGESNGTLMGLPVRTFTVMGYDNFKMSYVTSWVNSFDTAMTTAEGDLDPGGKTLISYGTLDEYLTGENDKMVKYVWRFVSDDEIHLEVHDLPIGENNAKVLDFTFRRRK